MSNSDIDNLILNYHDYSTITGKFNANRYYDYIDKYYLVLDYANVEPLKRQMYDKTYEEVYRHLNHGGVMTQYMIQGCKYISYLIHKEVNDTLKLHYDEKTFEIFRKFVEDYYNRIRSRSHTLCLPYIVYVNQDMYEKLDTLYRLYDLYTDVLSSNNYWNENKCLYFKLFLNSYNDYMRKNKPTSLKLNEILTHLEGYVSNTTKDLNGKCNDYTYILERIKLYKPHDEHKPPLMPELALHESRPLQNHVDNPGFRNTNTEVIEITKPTSPPPTSELGTTTRISGIEDVETELAPGRDPVSVIEQGIISKPPAEELHGYRTHARNETVEQSGHRQSVELSEQLKLMRETSLNSQNGLEVDQGFMANVRNTITGVLGEVDPVPVVGVSGGMGALFLLFKLEPSLEEADEDIESLLDSMEYIQDFSQVFKDMKMEILDTINLI
ncbi:unnamed protein product [Plasmodium vivax]|uniref:(malaria parasite P. vivax) hypothetical protein n=1 Tax=Plasmodium vivax TaxID=5855 RepID=A0A8S4HCG4_PLAVI|nr:unnamed protein product [Plasmodium vivax]